MGERVTLTCEIESGDYWNYEWYKYHAGVYTLKVRPTITSGYEGAVLTGNTVTLYCTLPQSAGWRFYWSKHTQSPEKKTITNIYTISSVRVSDGGGDVILDSPVHPVTERDSLTLRCLYRSTKPSNLTADFYRDGSLLQTQTTGEMMIRTVSKSDAGLYHCKHPEKGESPKSWLSVRGAPVSVLSLLSSLMAVSPYLLVSIVLGVKCYRAGADPDEESRT
ncbi:hypothetical protein NFI96_009092 [Prochilodus magdalenae]|nr:hypothetical protein NFI96_009092 [Prochilodus magdalenae]